MDAVPVLSQIKSFFQWVTKNSEGARETQKNFLKLCPVVSQVRSLVQTINGDSKGARETQMQFLKGLKSMGDSVPVVGHVKGAVHYVIGDKEGGHNAMKAASHATGVIVGGVVGFMVGGPVGAAAGGATGGLLMDGIITKADTLVNGEKAKPYGAFDTITRIKEDPTDAGNYVDLIGGIVLDGMTGYTAGKGIGKKIVNDLDKRKLAKTVGKENANMIVDAGDKQRVINSVNKIKSNKPQMLTIVKDNSTGKTFYGHNKQMRKVLKDTKDISNGPTELQKRMPSAKGAMGRDISTCAEQHAYNKLFKYNPDASPDDLISVTVKWEPKSKRSVTTTRCSNCLKFSLGMGDVPTDRISETPVPQKVTCGETAAAIALGVGIQTVDSDSADNYQKYRCDWPGLLPMKDRI